ncbi:hypothetical protein TRAPUB_5897 [Trametes pubescens]|uniref:Uncharacterized protein n=1 Tax=Trametes pubescens TaxID=154538 RepID=A0A1M2V7A2_TRAPU|nr:hypothetical protein TRAPUB_5897 [Trametes pubescens]
MDGTGLDSSQNASTSFIRVVSLSIALYESGPSSPITRPPALTSCSPSYILTLPAEWRFYRSQRSWRLSLGCLLFIAIRFAGLLPRSRAHSSLIGAPPPAHRYSSIAVITLSNVGYFGNFFTPASCARYFIIPPIFKVVQTMVSQLILGIRTVNISRRSKYVTWIIACTFLVCTAAQWFLNLWNRVSVQGRHNNCTAGNKPPVLTVWLYYLLSIVYDILTLGISSMYLISFSPNSGKMQHLRRIMLTDGLVYFVALTDAAAAHNRTVTTQLVVSRALPSAHSIQHAMRAQQLSSSKESKRRAHAHAHALSTGFDLDTADYGRSVYTVSVGSGGAPRSCGCSCDCGWASGEDRERSRGRGSRRKGQGQGRSRSLSASGTGSGSGTSGVGPVASATLGSGSHRGSRRARGGGDEEAGLPRGEHEDGIDEGDEKGEVSDVRVQIEETVTVEVEYDPEVYARESYRTPRVLWEVRGGGEGGGRGETRSWRSAGSARAGDAGLP